MKLKRLVIFKSSFAITILSVTFCLLILDSCVSKYIYTQKEIKKHYKNKQFSPKYGFDTSNTFKIHYAEFGCDTSPLLVLIHGGPGEWYGWLNFIDDDSIRLNYHLISVDRLGYGKSHRKPVLSIKEQADAILKVISKCDPNKKIYLVARSYGCPIAAYMATKMPNRVEDMLLISPVTHPDKEKFYWFSPLGKSRLINWMLPHMMNTATAEKYGHETEMKNIQGIWKDVYTNTTIVSGAKDWVADTCNYSYTDSILVNAEKQKYFLANDGHFITYSNFPFVRRIVLDFLKD